MGHFGYLDRFTSEVDTKAVGDSSHALASTEFVHSVMPAGTVLPFAGISSPTGWLLCDGSAVSRTTYSRLFSAIGSTYGAGDGSTTFNLPDLRGRAVAGKDDMGGTAANRLGVTMSGTRGSTANGVITGLSSTAGLTVGMKATGTGIGNNATIITINSSTQVTLSANNTATGTGNIRFSIVDGATLGDAGGKQNHSITYNQMAAHTHGNAGTGGFLVAIAGGSSGIGAGSNATLASATASQGADEAHPNVQPTIVLNYIIKAV